MTWRVFSFQLASWDFPLKLVQKFILKAIYIYIWPQQTARGKERTSIHKKKRKENLLYLFS